MLERGVDLPEAPGPGERDRGVPRCQNKQGATDAPEQCPGSPHFDVSVDGVGSGGQGPVRVEGEDVEPEPDGVRGRVCGEVVEYRVDQVAEFGLFVCGEGGKRCVG